MFSNPIMGGDGVLIRTRMRSDNYVAGVSGWSIARDGSAEFSDVTVRGDVIASSFATDVAPNDRIEITSAELGAVKFYYDGAATSADWGARIRSFLDTGIIYAGVEVNDVHPTQGAPTLLLNTDTTGATNTAIGISCGFGVGSPFLNVVGDNSVNISNGLDSAITIRPDGEVRIQNGATPGGYILIHDNASATDVHVELGLSSTDGFDIIAGGVTTFLTNSTGVRLAPAVNIGAAGSAAAPVLFLNGDTNSGVYQPAADQLGLSTNGTARLTITNTTTTISTGVMMTGLPTSAAAGQPMHYDNTFVPGTLYRFTSSARYKDRITPAASDWARRVLDIDVSSYIPKNPDTGWWEGPKRHGFIAEQVATVAPDLVLYDEHGRPMGVDSEQLLAALVYLVRRLYRKG